MLGCFEWWIILKYHEFCRSGRKFSLMICSSARQNVSFLVQTLKLSCTQSPDFYTHWQNCLVNVKLKVIFTQTIPCGVLYPILSSDLNDAISQPKVGSVLNWLLTTEMPARSLFWIVFRGRHAFCSSKRALSMPPLSPHSSSPPVTKCRLGIDSRTFIRCRYKSRSRWTLGTDQHSQFDQKSPVFVTLHWYCVPERNG